MRNSIFVGLDVHKATVSVAVTDAEERVARLTGQIEVLVPQWSMAPVVRAFQAMRGVAGTTGKTAFFQ